MIDDNRLLPLSAPRADLDRPLRDLTQVSAPVGGLVGSYSTGKTVSADQAHLRDYMKIVLKRKWLILSIVLVVTSITAIYMYRQPAVYEATTRILIEPRQKSFLQRAEININTGSDPAYRPTQLKLMQNPALIRLVALQLNLPNNTAFFPEGGRTGLLSAVRRAVGKKNDKEQTDEGGLNVVNDPAADDMSLGDVEGTQLTKEQRAQLEPYEDAIIADLTVAPVEKTNLVDISYQHTDPTIAMNVANTIADIFIAQDTFRSSFGSASQKEKLARQVIELQQQMSQLQRERIAYMRENNIPLGDAKGQNETALRLETTSGQALAAEKARNDLQAAYEAAMRTPDIMSVPQVQENKLIQGMQDKINAIRQERAVLLLKYTEQNPRVIEKDEQIRQIQGDIKRTARQTIESLGTAYKASIENAARFSQSYNKTRNASMTQSTAEIMLGDLNQRLETTKQFFNTASQRLKEMEISGDQLGANSITIQSGAREPREPVGPKRGRNIMIALLLSLGAGVGLAILLDNLDDTLKSVEDVDRYLHVPTLALIPAPRPERGVLGRGKASTNTALQPATGAPQAALALIEDSRSAVAEAYRHLRTSLLLSSAGQPPKTVLVTSSQPSEGKTTTAINTAITLAQTGAEVLLVDCDLRRPRIHVHFGMANARGLTNYLAGDATIDDVVQTYEKLPNLKILASGPVPPNPAELLGSEEMRKLVRELSVRFSHIIIDSPPAISFTDAAILSTIVDGVMLVVHGGRSSRAIVRRSRQLLLDVGAHIYGVVLNNVKLEANDYNYYAGYYAGDYEESTEDDADEDGEDDLVGAAAGEETAASGERRR